MSARDVQLHVRAVQMLVEVQAKVNEQVVEFEHPSPKRRFHHGIVQPGENLQRFLHIFIPEQEVDIAKLA